MKHYPGREGALFLSGKIDRDWKISVFKEEINRLRKGNFAAHSCAAEMEEGENFPLADSKKFF